MILPAMLSKGTRILIIHTVLYTISTLHHDTQIFLPSGFHEDKFGISAGLFFRQLHL